ncbi:histidine kinase [Bacillus sp. FJAT-50079]|uniref:sensor histidine kinase n=1 Tax=Bacillus sp. FJAT-50079 TaxID=2833577 RepID=UPI001BC9C1E5|nr:histidine kinase [Bacillus sp. FJAT-50079]MBS4206583.1 histidine kinase [Bacillus sp. FJAT-50079]
MKFLKFYYKSKSINVKIFLLATLSSLIPLSILTIFSFFYFSHVAEKQVSTTTTNFLEIADWNTNTFIVDIESIGNMLLGAGYVQDFLKQKTQESYNLQIATRDLLINVINNKEYINGIYLGNENIEYIIKNNGHIKYTDEIYGELKNTHTFQKIRWNKGRGSLYIEDDINLIRDMNSISYGKTINDINTFRSIGILLISFDDRVFKKMFGDIITDGNIVVAGQDMQVYYNKDSGMFTKGQLDNILSGLNKEGLIKKEIDGKQYIINYKTNSKTNWKIVSIMPYKSLISSTINHRNITIILIAFSFILALISSSFITNRITHQLNILKRVTKKMESGNGKIDRLSFDIEDEIGRIGNKLITLYNRNNKLIIKLYESRLKTKEVQLLNLQNNINPHFLYNTLNSMYLMSEKYNAKPVAKMALSMSEYFRLVLNNGDFITTIHNEIEQIKRYLEIMNVRYGGKINISIDIDPHIVNEKIIKLLIQPLVENAIIHGLAMKEGRKDLKIVGKKSKSIITLEVIDNGVGFDYKQIISIDKGYALKNIDNRIKLYYGNDFGLTIESNIDKGTIARITVNTEV